MGGAWSTPGAYVYILRLLHRLGYRIGNHYQLLFDVIQWVANMPICGCYHCLCSQRGGRYIYYPSLNDKNDKESEKSPMRVIGRGLWKPCHCCHSCHGRCVGRSLTSVSYAQQARYTCRARQPVWVLQRLCVLALLVQGNCRHLDTTQKLTGNGKDLHILIGISTGIVTARRWYLSLYWVWWWVRCLYT